jgi:hypothetical protein
MKTLPNSVDFAESRWCYHKTVSARGSWPCKMVSESFLSFPKNTIH